MVGLILGLTPYLGFSTLCVMRGEPTYAFDIPNGELKLKELMLHIADRCSEDSTFGATKLNKILWWSDFSMYRKTGTPITGVEYQKLPNGPAPRKLMPMRKAMIEEREAVVREKENFEGYTQQCLIPLRSADYSLFASSEIAFCDRVIDEMKGKTAKEVSSISHGKAWEVAREGESIPYQFAFLSDEPITQADVVRTKELARRLGWKTVIPRSA